MNKQSISAITVVQVATVWTSSHAPRLIDHYGIENPTNIRKWVECLSDEEKLVLCDDNRVQTQLLYGERVIITEMDDDWAHVVIPSQPSCKDKRGYPGWVLRSQLAEINSDIWESTEKAAVQQRTAMLLDAQNEPLIELSFMTTLPVLEVLDNMVKVLSHKGPAFILQSDVKVFSTDKGLPPGNGADLIRTGESFIGLDYFWGGMSAYGFDCSGFVYAVHRANGYQISRDAIDQINYGKVVSIEDCEPGDMMFFAYEEGKGKIHHIGLYYGEGKLLHSPNVGKSIEVISLEGTVYEKELCAIRRCWG